MVFPVIFTWYVYFPDSVWFIVMFSVSTTHLFMIDTPEAIEKIKDENLENVTGGVQKRVWNQASEFSPICNNPSGEQIASIQNNTYVEVTGNKAFVNGRPWSEITWGDFGYGWIESWIVGE